MKEGAMVLWENTTDYKIKSIGVARAVTLSYGWDVGRGGAIWL